ncbi:MAG: type I secretion C-terminal target domain-containing protein, partial [Gammaproteobacteria bacterium]|nr:type I secretion C-terminal target domain-containing protein [Gammaproteobacteria bacterium]
EIILEAITFGIDASDHDPSTTARTVTLNTITDNSSGVFTSTDISATATITVNVANDIPTIINLGGDTLSYTEGDGAQIIDQSPTSASVTDVDSSDFDDGKLTVSFTMGGVPAEDILGIHNQGYLESQISVAGWGVAFEGTTIGTFAGGVNGDDLVITFNANADADAVQALIRNITYVNSNSGSATAGDRTVRYVLTDGDGGTSTIHDTTVSVTAVNQDPTFNTGDGIVSTDNPVGLDNYGDSVAVQRVSNSSDDKILVAGIEDDMGRVRLARYNEDGSLDASFGTNGIAVDQVWTGTPVFGASVLSRSDGGILVGATTSENNFIIFAYTEDGQLDTNFGSSTGFLITNLNGIDRSHGLIEQADGKILQIGHSIQDGDAMFALARYNTQGSLDTSFGTTGTVTFGTAGSGYWGTSVAMQGDGKILISGWYQDSGKSYFAIMRLNTNGVLDTTFGDTSAADPTVKTGTMIADFASDYNSKTSVALTVLEDGNILVGGLISGRTNSVLARYDENGQLDTSFGVEGKAVFSNIDITAQSVVVQSNGDIVVVGKGIGENSESDLLLIGIDKDGKLDTSFGKNGISGTAYNNDAMIVRDAVVQIDDKILVAGYTTKVINFSQQRDFALVRYNADGSLDKSFALENTIDGTAAFTEGGAVEVLDDNVEIRDVELDTLNDGLGNYDGASLTLARSGSASAEDVFSETGTLAALSDGAYLVVDETTIGMVANSGGTLMLTFNGNATTALVNSAMQQIAYSNTSDTPQDSVQIDWRFDDGNTTDSQGTGGLKVALGSTTVSITPTDDLPEFAAVSNITVYEGGRTYFRLQDITDPDSENIIVKLSANVTVEGKLGLDKSVPAGIVITEDPGNNVIMLEGTVGDLKLFLEKSENLYYENSDYSKGTGTIKVQVAYSVTDFDTEDQHYSKEIAVTVEQTANGFMELPDISDINNAVLGVSHNLGITDSNAQLVDGDETRSITLDGISAGSQITDGDNIFTADINNSYVEIGGWNLSNLEYIGYSVATDALTFTAKSIDGTFESTEVSKTFNVTVSEDVNSPDPQLAYNASTLMSKPSKWEPSVALPATGSADVYDHWDVGSGVTFNSTDSGHANISKSFTLNGSANSTLEGWQVWALEAVSSNTTESNVMMEFWVKFNEETGSTGEYLIYETGSSKCGFGVSYNYTEDEVNFLFNDISAPNVTLTADLASLGVDIKSDFVQIAVAIDVAKNELHLYINGDKASSVTQNISVKDWYDSGDGHGADGFGGVYYSDPYTGPAGAPKPFTGEIAIQNVYASDDLAVDKIETNYSRISGTSGPRSLVGNVNSELLVGGAGNDTIIADETGGATIIGGMGDDSLFGGSGVDIFKFRADDKGSTVAPAVDTIENFTVGRGGDELDLSDMLQGESASDISSLGDYLNFSFDNGDTTISVDVDGAGAGGVVQQIVLTGVDLSGYYDIIDTLIDARYGNLIVDP